MTTLMAQRRAGPRTRAESRATEQARQESLFAGESLAPSPSPSPWRARVSAPPSELAPVAASAPPAAPAPAVPATSASAPPAPLPAAPHEPAPAAPLARPTLDDAISRMWEGLLIGLPAGCPVCGGELQTALGGPAHGHCGSCGSSID